MTDYSPPPSVGRIVAGDNVSLDPASGVGSSVTINAEAPLVPATEWACNVAVMSGPYSGALGSFGPTTLIATGNVSFDPAALTGVVAASASLPVTTYPAGSVVGPGSVSIAGLPDSADAMALAVSLVVASQDGSNIATLQYSGSVPAHTADFTIEEGDYAFTQVAGTDLTWDVSSSSIVSAAGGVYGVVVTFNAAYS